MAQRELRPPIIALGHLGGLSVLVLEIVNVPSDNNNAAQEKSSFGTSSCRDATFEITARAAHDQLLLRATESITFAFDLLD